MNQQNMETRKEMCIWKWFKQCGIARKTPDAESDGNVNKNWSEINNNNTEQDDADDHSTEGGKQTNNNVKKSKDNHISQENHLWNVTLHGTSMAAWHQEWKGLQHLIFWVSVTFKRFFLLILSYLQLITICRQQSKIISKI